MEQPIQPIVSVIIPVYNAEKTIRRCLDSILNQSYRQLEILIIDDGSKDASLDICLQYKRNCKNIIVVQQKNSGPAVARNQGICFSSGKYLAFVDADDYISQDMIKTLVEKAEKECVDMVICAYWLVTRNGLNKQYYNFAEGLYEGKKLKLLLYSMVQRNSMEDIPPFSWVRLISKQTITKHSLWFQRRLIRSEDFHFWCRVHQQVNKIYLLSKTPLYYYVENEESITHRYVAKYWEGAKFIYDDLKKHADNDEYLIYSLNKMLIMRSRVALSNSSRCISVRQAFQEIYQIIFDSYLYNVIMELPEEKERKYQKYIFFIRHNLRVILFLIFICKYLKRRLYITNLLVNK